ncbi:MAG: NfeD family protein [Betaproteobacteria bacterium]|nr:NfeD family protein [Betaproteobacteria bacterium]
MADYLVWLIAGLVLVIVELLSGTFYLLVLGLAAFAAAAVAWAGPGIWAQTIAAAAVAAAGVVLVHHWRKGSARKQMPSLDVGQMAAFESWVSEDGRQARVKYRDTSWDAQVEGPAEGRVGEIFHIVAVDGNTLKISKTRTA